MAYNIFYNIIHYILHGQTSPASTTPGQTFAFYYTWTDLTRMGVEMGVVILWAVKVILLVYKRWKQFVQQIML
jgi:hypothetical protein